MASASGRRIVDMVWDDLKPREILTEKALKNAVTTIMALGGSTNSAIHLLAVGRRASVDIDLSLLSSSFIPQACYLSHQSDFELPEMKVPD